VASPVQHFWSLGVEEQFYFAWPIILVLCLLSGRVLKALNSKLVLIIVLSVLLLSSLWLSIVESYSGSAASYFETTTRVWELLLGALVAVTGVSGFASRLKSRQFLKLVAWAVLVFTVVGFSAKTVFPGYLAGLPVLATVALIALGAPQRASKGRRSATTPGAAKPNRFIGKALLPAKFIGDISYSLYLWHWPLLILTPWFLHSKLNDAQLVAVLALAIFIAWLSKTFVEEPLRRAPAGRLPHLKTFVASTASLAFVAALIVPLQMQNAQAAATEKAAGLNLFLAETPCFGAAAVDASAFDCANNGLAKNFVTPSPQNLHGDIPDRYVECQAAPYSKTPVECIFGVKGGTRVALAGDSHAFMWIDTLEALAKEHNWEVHSFARASCPFSHVAWPRNIEAQSGTCAIYNNNLDQLLATQDPYEYLFTSLKSVSNTPASADKAGEALKGFKESWMPLIARNTKVIAVKDVPRSQGNQATCALEHPNSLDLCLTDFDYANGQHDWLFDSAAKVEGVFRVDLTEYFCKNNLCPQIIGSVFVYRDSGHISATYSRTLAPFLWQKLVETKAIS